MKDLQRVLKAPKEKIEIVDDIGYYDEPLIFFNRFFKEGWLGWVLRQALRHTQGRLRTGKAEGLRIMPRSYVRTRLRRVNIQEP